ncbi:proline-rich protein 36-like [Homarus americanus]|uniref:proline-rich protein 36-like n=1 Tax=Homarus americanus TaxID=6706 RepID=UPI001C439A26|nr:proline-rich protein 36-like [Homarus americanus]
MSPHEFPFASSPCEFSHHGSAPHCPQAPRLTLQQLPHSRPCPTAGLLAPHSRLAPIAGSVPQQALPHSSLGLFCKSGSPFAVCPLQVSLPSSPHSKSSHTACPFVCPQVSVPLSLPHCKSAPLSVPTARPTAHCPTGPIPLPPLHAPLPHNARLPTAPSPLCLPPLQVLSSRTSSPHCKSAPIATCPH